MFVRVGTSPNNKYDPVEISAKLPYPQKTLLVYIFLFCCHLASLDYNCLLEIGFTEFQRGYLHRKQVLSMFVSLNLIKTPVTCFVGFRSSNVRRVIK